MNYGQIFAALRQRKLVQTIVVYVGVSCGILQVLSFFGTTYDWPRAVIDVSLYLLSCGFVVAVTVAWFHGERGHQDVTRADLAPFLRAGDASVRAAALLAAAELDLWQGRASTAVKAQEQGLSAATAARGTMLEDRVLLALAGSWALPGQHDRVAAALAPRGLGAPAMVLPYAAALGSLGRLQQLQRFRARVAASVPPRSTRGADTARVAAPDAYLAFYRGEWSTAASRFQAARERHGAGRAVYVDAREISALLNAARPADALMLLRQPSDSLELTALREHRRLYPEGRALEALGRGAEALADYRRILADWGPALAGFPEFRYVPDRLARLAG